MIYAILGKDKFQEGLQHYMSKHRYDNTETIDLWNAWTKVSGKG
jgi:aminopeptidase N